MFRFTTRDLPWLTVVASLALGWWLDRSGLASDARQWRWFLSTNAPFPLLGSSDKIVEAIADENASLKEQIELQKKLIEVLKAERQEISNKVNPAELAAV